MVSRDLPKFWSNGSGRVERPLRPAAVAFPYGLRLRTAVRAARDSLA